MTGTTKSLGQKHLLDKFYTKEDIVKQCLSLLDLTQYDCIIEPSAGAGAFSPANPHYMYDIEPEGAGIIQADWLTLDKSVFAQYSKILVVGNPPFGQQSSLAKRFFNESAKFAHTIAFILPLSFKKDSVQNQLNLNFILAKEIILPRNSFSLNGQDYELPCVFQVWDRSPRPRSKKRLKTTTSLFSFCNKESADFRIQRVGGNAGKASFDLERAISSNYFVKNTSNFSNEELVNIINSLSFPSIAMTVGPKSLAKGELIATLEEYCETLDNE